MSAFLLAIALLGSPSVHPWPIGPGPRYTPPARTAAVAAGKPVGSLTCGPAGTSFRLHLELFAGRKVIVVPAGIGAARRAASTRQDDRARRDRPGRDRQEPDARRPLPDLGPAARRPPPRVVHLTDPRPRVRDGRLVHGPLAAIPLTPMPRSCSSSAPTSPPTPSSCSPEVIREAARSPGRSRGRPRPRRLRRLDHVNGPTVQPAATYRLVDLKPSGPDRSRQAGSRLVLDRAAGRHAAHPVQDGPRPAPGVHLIIVRNDLAYMIHVHPPVGKKTISETVTFPAPGPYRVVVDVYPKRSRTAERELPAVREAEGRRRRTSRSRFHRPQRVRRSAATRSSSTAPRAEGDPGEARRRSTSPGRPASPRVPALVRRARPRDLLPPGHARLLPHSRLRARA